MITSRITTDMAAPVPPEVAAALGLEPGDSVGFVIQAGEVRLLRAPEEDATVLDAWIEQRLSSHAATTAPLLPAEEVFDRVLDRLHRRSGPNGA